MLSEIVADQEKTATSGRMERVRRVELPTLSLAIIAIRSTGVNFIANFPEIHPIFSANSSVKVKDFDVQKIDSGVLQTELCARAIRKRDGAGIAPYQQAC